MSERSPVPLTLEAIAANPAMASSLTPSERAIAVLRCSAVLAALAGPAFDESQPVTPTEAASREEDDRLLTVPQVAELLGFASSYVYEMIRRKEFPALRRGKYVRVRKSALIEWIRRKETGLDFVDSTVLSRQNDRKRGQANPAEARAHAGRSRQRARRSLDNRVEMGDRRRQGDLDRGAAPSTHGEAERGAGQKE